MADELELLKKDWQRKEEYLPKLSYSEIHKMIWKKSSSIVRWILIISILELTLPNLLYLLPEMDKSPDIYKSLGILNISRTIWWLGYGVTLYFIYQFYRRYKEISILDSAKDLMEKIIKTRRTVKYYIICTLSLLLVFCIVLVSGMALSDNLVDIFANGKDIGDMDTEKFKTMVVVFTAIFSLVLIAVMGGLYFLLYGLLLRKLKKNYRELKKLEV